MKRAQCLHSTCLSPCLSRNAEQDGTDRDDAGVVGDEVAGCHVPSLVFVAANVQRELHGALGAELITRAVLAHTGVLLCKKLPELPIRSNTHHPQNDSRQHFA